MSAPIVAARRRTRTTAIIRGDHRTIVDALITTAVTFHWARREGGYVVPLSVLDRVLIAVENAGYRVDCSEGLW